MDSNGSIKIKISTRDSQHTLQINKCIPVPSLKEQIAVSTGVSSYQQQLVFRGTDLRDDKLLSDYHVEDGDTIGLIVTQNIISDPPQDGGSLEFQRKFMCALLQLGSLTLESENEEEDGFYSSWLSVVCALPASDSSTPPDLAHQHGHSNNNSQQAFDQSN